VVDTGLIAEVDAEVIIELGVGLVVELVAQQDARVSEITMRQFIVTQVNPLFMQNSFSFNIF